MQIMSMAGLSCPAVRRCIDLFETGWSAIRPALRGRSPGHGRTLSQAQEDSLQRTIIDKRPEQIANQPMTLPKRTPERVIAYFQDRRVRHAAGFFNGPDQ